MNYIAHKILSFIQDLGLLIIAIATVIAMGMEISNIIDSGVVHLAD